MSEQTNTPRPPEPPRFDEDQVLEIIAERDELREEVSRLRAWKEALCEHIAAFYVLYDPLGIVGGSKSKSSASGARVDDNEI